MRDANFKRDAAIRMLSGELIMLVDSDVVLPPDWLSRAVAALGDSGASCVTGGLKSIHDSFWGRYTDSTWIGPRPPASRSRTWLPVQISEYEGASRRLRPTLCSPASCISAARSTHHGRTVAMKTMSGSGVPPERGMRSSSVRNFSAGITIVAAYVHWRRSTGGPLGVAPTSSELIRIARLQNDGGGKWSSCPLQVSPPSLARLWCAPLVTVRVWLRSCLDAPLCRCPPGRALPQLGKFGLPGRRIRPWTGIHHQPRDELDPVRIHHYDPLCHSVFGS